MLLTGQSQGTGSAFQLRDAQRKDSGVSEPSLPGVLKMSKPWQGDPQHSQHALRPFKSLLWEQFTVLGTAASDF